ncbi:DddA-like double-stranded DNA deaminase toxin [Kribbella sp. NPDC051770]|uniref:DddA-like double-stranded DNA deaminase toxin n=1 Tax=Kribbella sp. NPDC051770 TaxID=3155413 RepID=UPI00342B103E
MPSELQRVAQDLVTCLDQLPAVAAALDTRARRCRETAGYLASFSGSNPALQAAIYHLDAAAAACEMASRQAVNAHHRARNWAASMVGNAGGSSGQGSTQRPQTGNPAGQPVNRTMPDVPDHNEAPDPKAQTIIRRLPIRENDEGKTRGFWFGSSDGKESPLVSGRDRFQEEADRLAREQLRIPKTTTTSHVEVKFAILMRERGLSDETIYINNKPCEGRWGCRTWLPKFLPPGARLTVHWPDSAPETFEGEA